MKIPDIFQWHFTYFLDDLNFDNTFRKYKGEYFTSMLYIKISFLFCQLNIAFDFSYIFRESSHIKFCIRVVDGNAMFKDQILTPGTKRRFYDFILNYIKKRLA